MAIYVWPQKTQKHTERISQKAFLLYRFTFCENLCHSVADKIIGVPLLFMEVLTVPHQWLVLFLRLSSVRCACSAWSVSPVFR
jgi:hypothetical protein